MSLCEILHVQTIAPTPYAPNKYMSESQKGLEACIAQAGTEPLILPPSPLECWDFKHVSPWLAGKSGPFWGSRASHRAPVMWKLLPSFYTALHTLPFVLQPHSQWTCTAYPVSSLCTRLRFHPGSDQAQTREQPQRAVSPECPATAELIPHAQPTSLLANSTRGYFKN